MRFRFDTDGKPLTEIAHESICDRAAFRLDKPLECTIDDVFELRQGAWYKLAWSGEGFDLLPLSGRWVLPRIKVIPQRPAKKVSVMIQVDEENDDG